MNTDKKNSSELCSGVKVPFPRAPPELTPRKTLSRDEAQWRFLSLSKRGVRGEFRIIDTSQLAAG